MELILLNQMPYTLSFRKTISESPSRRRQTIRARAGLIDFRHISPLQSGIAAIFS